MAFTIVKIYQNEQGKLIQQVVLKLQRHPLNGYNFGNFQKNEINPRIQMISQASLSCDIPDL